MKQNFKKKYLKPPYSKSQHSKAQYSKTKYSKTSATNSAVKTPYSKTSASGLGQQKPFRPLLVWGKHVVESFLEKLQKQPNDDHKPKREQPNSYLLHILADRSGKIPGQLAYASDMAQIAKIKIITHRSETEGWPLSDVHEGIVHQRLCLEVPEYPTEDISLACEFIKEFNEQSQFGCAGIVLDQVQDPRNFGAILRSAAFFGVKFVIYAQNRQADISPLVLKASAGGAFEVNLIPVVNINRALQDLKHAGAWILGTANTPEAANLETLPKDRVWVCALGNEGSGLRVEVLKNCDFVTKIPGGTKNLDSLNVSVAAGVIMHTLQENK